MLPFHKSFTVTRRAADSYNSDGILVPGVTSTITITGSVQPLRDDEIETLPEGFRNSAAVKIYSDQLIYPARQAGTDGLTSPTSADEVSAFGKTWQVITYPEYRQANIIAPQLLHYKVLATKKAES